MAVESRLLIRKREQLERYYDIVQSIDARTDGAIERNIATGEEEGGVSTSTTSTFIVITFVSVGD